MIRSLPTHGTNGDAWPNPWVTAFSGGTGTADIQSNKLRMQTAATGAYLCMVQADIGIPIYDRVEIRCRVTPGQTWVTESFFDVVILDAWRTSVSPQEPQNGYSADVFGQATPKILLSSDVASTEADTGQTANARSGSTAVNVVFRRVGGVTMMKAYDDGTAEPAAWDLIYTPTVPVSTGPWRLGFSIVCGNAAAAVRFDVDNITVDDLNSAATLALPAILATGGPVALAGDCSISTATAGVTKVATAFTGAAALTTAVAGSVAVAATLQGSVAVTTADTGTLAVATGLTGSSTVTTAASAAVTLAAAFAGTTTITAANAGAVAVAATLQGSSTATFADAGVIAVGKTFAGSSSATFATAGAATVAVTFASTTAAIFAAAGAIDVAGTAVALAGNSDVTFAASGVMNVATRFAGTAAVTFADTAVIGVAVSYAGTTTIAFLPAGATAIGAGLAGDASVAFTVAGNLANRVGLSGVSAVLFAVAGALTAAGSSQPGYCTLSTRSAGLVLSDRVGQVGALPLVLPFVLGGYVELVLTVSDRSASLVLTDR